MGTAGLIETIGALMAQASFTSNDNNNNNNASSQGDSNGDDDESSVAAAATAGGNALKQIVFGCVGIIKNLCAGNNGKKTGQRKQS